MEISGIGGYLNDVTATRSLSTSANTEPTLQLSRGALDNPLDAQSLCGSTSDRGTQLLSSYRASEPILLDFDLPTSTSVTTAAHENQSMRASSTRLQRKSALRLDNVQPSVHLNASRRAEYKQMLEDRVASVLLKRQAAWDGTSGIFDDPKDWKLHVSKPNLSMYRHRRPPGSDEGVSATPHQFVATGRIRGVTLQDIEYGLYADTTLDERSLNAYWLSENFLDAGIVETYETRSEDDPFGFFGVKWLLTGSLERVKRVAPLISAYVQLQKTVIDELGEKVLVRVVDSVPADIVALVPERGGVHFVPFDLAIAYLYRYDAKSDSVQVFCEGRVAAAGWLPNLSLTMLSKVIAHQQHVADAKYITKHGLMFPREHNLPTASRRSSTALSASTAPAASATREDALGTPNWVPNKKRKVCFVCFKSFSLLRRRRHHCRMCGEVVCAACVMTLPLVAPQQFDGSKDAHFPLKNQPESKKLDEPNRRGLPVVHEFKFCTKCLLAVRQERRAMTAGVSDYYFREGMTHHYAQMQAALAGGGCDDDDNESGYLNSSGNEEDDESIVDDVRYSKRIETLRQEHMAREKQKLREQHQSPHHARGMSIRLLDDDAVSLGSTSRRQSSSSDVSERNFSAANRERLGTRSSLGSLQESAHDPRRRSFSIPDHFELLERSIAEQEALISCIQQQQRAMAMAGEARLPIGAVMRSIAQTKPSVLLSPVTNVVDNQVEFEAAVVTPLDVSEGHE